MSNDENVGYRENARSMKTIEDLMEHCSRLTEALWDDTDVAFNRRSERFVDEGAWLVYVVGIDEEDGSFVALDGFEVEHETLLGALEGLRDMLLDEVKKRAFVLSEVLEVVNEPKGER